MKLLKLSIVLMGCMLLLTSCFGVKKEENKIDITKMSAEEIVTIFVDAGYPIDNVSTYDAETDPNKMLGRPGSYISKTDFADTRLDQSTFEGANPSGGMIEVFEDSKDAQVRIDYVHAIVSQPGIFFQYEYSYKNVYFRLDGKLTPTQALQYEQAFKSLTEGKLPQPYVEWDE